MIDIATIKMTFMRGQNADTEDCTELGYKVGPRLRELVPHGQREPGGGIHAT